MLALLPELQETIQHEIPLAAAMQLTALLRSGEVCISAPLAPNINHKHTAFAGSLNAALTLAGWSCCWLIVREAELRGITVIQDSSVEYLRPVTADFTAQCALPDEAAQSRFLRTLQRRGQARIELKAAIYERGQLAVSFSGRYVVQL